MADTDSQAAAADAQVQGEKPEIQARRLEYNKAIRDARLAVLVLSSVQFNIDRAISISPGERPVVTCRGEVVGFGFNNEKGACFVEIQWSVLMRASKKKYASCKAEYHVGYDGLHGVSEDVVRLISENLGQPATFAYFRALYSNLDWAAAIGTPPLPLIKFMPRLFGAPAKPLIASHK